MVIEIIETVDVDIAPPGAERIVRCGDCEKCEMPPKGFETMGGYCTDRKRCVKDSGYCSFGIPRGARW